MKKQQVGLVIEGNLTSSTLLRLPGIASELGPIKSSGLQVARRVSNFLKGGYAVTSYGELESARAILIRIPDNSLDRVVMEICTAQLDWSERSIILCETWSPTEALQPLKEQGASIASVVSLPPGTERTFVVEGDPAAVRQMRRLIEREDARSIELRTGAKHLLFASAILCTAIPVPLLLMAQQALRDSGLSGKQLSATIQQMTGEMLQGFLKGARTTWGGPLADSTKLSQSIYWERLNDTHPEMASKLRDLVDWSQAQMGNKMSRSHGA